MPNPTWPEDLELKCDHHPMFNNDGADQKTMVGRVRRTGLVNSVEFIPNWNQTGVVTNNRTFTLFNRRSDGTGTTTMAIIAMTSGTNFTSGVASSMALQTAANRIVAVGDVLELVSLHVGSGLPDVGGKIVVQQSFTP